MVVWFHVAQMHLGNSLSIEVMNSVEDKTSSEAYEVGSSSRGGTSSNANFSVQMAQARSATTAGDQESAESSKADGDAEGGGGGEEDDVAIATVKATE